MYDVDSLHLDNNDGLWVWTHYYNPIYDKDLKIQVVKNFEIMQCTGLIDKNGTLIYEGDIVKIDNELNCIVRAHNKYDMDYGRIEFILIGCHPKCPTIYIPTVAHESEVIGNIYKNKELLNE